MQINVTRALSGRYHQLYSSSHRDFIGMKELDIKYMAMPILRSSSYVTVKSEYIVPCGYAIEDGKYIDLVIFPKNTTGATALIELRSCAPVVKHIKQKEYSDALLKEKINDAKKQLQSYKQAEEFQHQDVVAWIMISHSAPTVSVKTNVFIRKVYKIVLNATLS